MSEKTIPVLSEHQSAADQNSTNPSEYTPSNEERKAIKLATRLFEKAKRHRKKYDEKFLDRYKMFRGKQWKENRPSYRHSEVVNFVFQTIQAQVPIMTDARPRFDFMPQEPQDMEFAEILSEVAQSDWERGNWTMKLAENVYDSHFYGTSLAEMGFDPQAEHGAGGITYDSTDVFYFFPDPSARDVNDRCDFIVIAEPIDVEVLRRQYPKYKKFLKPDLIDLMQGDKADLDQVKFKSPVDSKTIIEGGSASEVAHRDQALKITVWTKSDEFDEEEVRSTGEDGAEKVEYVQKLKYPNGRKIVISNGVLLHDGPNPYDDGEFPFARLVNYILPREFWGMSEVEQLEGPQKIFNKLVSFALDVLTLMGNPIWLVPSGSGVDTDNLFNKPGLIVEFDGESPPVRQEGVQLQPYVFQMIDRLREWFDGISGANDVTRGVKPEGVTAASAISELQDAAQTRIRMKSRNLDAFLQRLGTLYKNRVFQFYSAPRIVRLTAKDGAQKYFRMHIKNQDLGDGSSQRVASVTPFNETSEGPREDAVAREYLIRGDFDVRVTTGSSLPFAKAQKSNLAFKLLEAGAIDQLELLKAVEYPNAEAVWERVQQRQMEQAQAQAEAEAAAQAPPPEQAPPPAA